MDTERSGLDEAMDVGSSTVSHLKSLKTAATFSKAGYGAALGGPFTAAIGAVIANRNQLAKILLVILAILLLPVLFIVMLPGLIFGSLTEQSDVLNSNSMISENIRASREAIVEVLEESHEDILASGRNGDRTVLGLIHGDGVARRAAAAATAFIAACAAIAQNRQRVGFSTESHDNVGCAAVGDGNGCAAAGGQSLSVDAHGLAVSRHRCD